MEIFKLYGVDEIFKSPSCIIGCIDFVTSTGIGKVALVHLESFVRISRRDEIMEMVSQVGECGVVTVLKI